MREIKFRAWDKKKKKWYMPPKPIDSIIGSWSMTSDGRTYVNGRYQELELMQYVGVKDSKNVEIYEGDIVLTDEAGWKARVVYTRDRFYCVDDVSGFSFDCNWNKFEVIGNIYENPELLEEK